ncbi:MAG: type III polyketide synthase [Janthinobacterium lividum]
MTEAYLNRIATAVPEHDVHSAFVAFADGLLAGSDAKRVRGLFNRMATRSGIEHRYSVLTPNSASTEFQINAHEFYRNGAFPHTAQRMSVYERFAPILMRRALDNLNLDEAERAAITHVIVTTCTGLYAPGLDFEAVDHLGLRSDVERTMIGFMGCYAAINGLKTARHIVRSEPEAKVLMVNLELCTLHLQETTDLEQVLSFLVFADGCAASLISAEKTGFALDSFRAVMIPTTRDLITWKIGGVGFDMLLSGQVPGAIGKALEHGGAEVLGDLHKDNIRLWGVHPGGKSVLDAVERGLGLPKDALNCSREVLQQFGNMSSATVMFVLERLMAEARPGDRGCAMSFGPGLTAETMLFHAA